MNPPLKLALSAIALSFTFIPPALSQTETDARIFVRLVNQQLEKGENPYRNLATSRNKVADGLKVCQRLDEGLAGEAIGQYFLKASLERKDFDLLNYASIVALYAIPGLCPRHSAQFEPLRQTVLAGMAQTLCQAGETKYCKFIPDESPLFNGLGR